MFKVPFLLLFACLSISAPASFDKEINRNEEEPEELNYENVDLDYSKWSAFDGSNSSSYVQIDKSSTFNGSYDIKITKNINCFSGATIDISKTVDKLVDDDKADDVVCLNFKINNLISLPSTDELKISLGFKDNSIWNVLSTQSLTGFPSLYDIDLEETVQIDFSCLPSGYSFTQIQSFTIGVDGINNAEFYLYDLSFGCSSTSTLIEKEIPTPNSIASYASTFGKYQYGGMVGTNTAHQVLNDADKSKETDHSCLEVSISGTSSTSGRIYSSYFQLKNQASACSLNQPKSIYFWVYNPQVISGGLLFKVGSTEFTSGHIFDNEGNELTFTRNLDYVGFRKYVLDLSSEQFKSSELEIGLWGAENDTKIYLSSFGFIDLREEQIGYLYFGALNNFNYSDYTTGPSFIRNSGVNFEKSHASDGSFVEINRSSHTESYYSCIYLQKFGNYAQELNVKKPTLLSLWAYNEAETSEDTGLAFKFKFSDSSIAEVYPNNSDRGLNFTGLRNYIIDISSYNIFDIIEFEMAVWGTEDADVFFSDIEIYDASTPVGEPEKFEAITIEENDFSLVSSEISASMSYVDDSILFVSKKNGIFEDTYLERTIDDFKDDKLTNIKVDISSEENIEDDILRFDLVYADETTVESLYTVDYTSINGAHCSSFEVDLTTLPYFVNASNITKIRISVAGEEEEISFKIDSLWIVKDENAECLDIYSYTVCDFEDPSCVYDWGISGESSSIYAKDYSYDAKIGDGCLSIEFDSMTDENFSWCEVYYNLNELVVKNSDKDVLGLSFWLYNTHYITSGNFGFWIKVAQVDGLEFEIQFDKLFSERNTSNNLAWTGWQKIQIPFDEDCYTEATYNPGYSRDAERKFDWKKLQYIKFGYWGSYYNADEGYSALGRIDDFRLLSHSQIIDETLTYNINYVLNGGKLDKNVKTTYTEGESFTLPTPKRSGFTFEGWYLTNSMTGSPVTQITSDMKGDITLYAAWSKKENSANAGIIIGASVGGGVLISGGIVLLLLRKKKH